VRFRWLHALAVLCLAGSLIGPAVAAAPKTLTVVDNADPSTLDLWNNGDLGEGLGRVFYEGLFRIDEHARVLPELVKTWSVSPDGLTYTFHLQTGVTFHDGTPFNAEAVKVNFDRVLDPGNHLQKYGLYHTVSHIASVKVLDGNTVQMTLGAPSGTIINNLAHPSSGMISPAALAKYGKDIASHPVGTGPYVFDSWTHGDRIVAKANSHYWQPGLPGLDQIIFRDVPDATQGLAMLKTGEAQFISPVDPVNVKSLQGQSGIRVVATPSIYETYVAMNERAAPLNNPRVRLALNDAVNKQALISALYLGYARQMTSVIGSQLEGYVDVGTYGFDVAKAKALLAEAGYPQGFSINLWAPNDTFSEKEAVFLQQQLAQVGVKVNVQTMESGTFSSSVFQGPDTNKGQLVLFGFAPSNVSSAWALRSNLTTQAWAPSMFNVSFYSNPQVDKWLDDAERTTAVARRNSDYRQIQQTVYRDAPWIWLAEPMNIIGETTNLTGAYVVPDSTIRVQYARFK
jgi:glutathione transport system substrate-binding protein